MSSCYALRQEPFSGNVKNRAAQHAGGPGNAASAAAGVMRVEKERHGTCLFRDGRLLAERTAQHSLMLSGGVLALGEEIRCVLRHTVRLPWMRFVRLEYPVTVGQARPRRASLRAPVVLSSVQLCPTSGLLSLLRGSPARAIWRCRLLEHRGRMTFDIFPVSAAVPAVSTRLPGRMSGSICCRRPEDARVTSLSLRCKFPPRCVRRFLLRSGWLLCGHVASWN